MPSEALTSQEPSELTKEGAEGEHENPPKSKKSSSGTWPAATAGSSQLPPPKTDKPRPHVCATCTRSFARLEHLKRHERSHTKEKPFECPECTRCFARRDLLLRHQQKLHLTTTPSSRPRSGRRESTSSSIASAKVRKNSQAQGGTGSMRPRANTISHIDGGTLGMMAPSQPQGRRRNPNASHHRHASLAELEHIVPGPHRGASSRMLKINTHGLVDVGGSLRTAPAFGGFPQDTGMEDLFFSGSNTINPAQLHFADSPASMQFDSPSSPFAPGYTFGHLTMDDDSNFDWINGFDSQMSFANANEHAIAGSSPSAMSGGSPGRGESLNETQMHLTPEQWQDSLLSQAPLVPHYDNDWGLTSEMNNETLSPINPDFPEVKFSTPSFNIGSSMGAQPAFANSLLNFGSQTDSPNTAASVSSGSNRHSSVTSVGTDMVTDATRQSLLALLSHSSQIGHRKFSQPAVSSPLSPGYAPRPRSAMGANLPSTADLQRYVNAYIQNFHPRLPFLHIQTLNFDTLGAINNSRTANAKTGFHFSVATGDGGCLLLSMAAIGALFEFEYTASKELFDLAKKLIHLYLEERRRADMCAAIGVTTNNPDSSTPSTPLWLVQSMLLNVVYGYNCGDRPPADLASTHCAALVSLARAAGLARASHPLGIDDIHMGGDPWGSGQHSFDETTWYTWKIKEEKKRTLYSIFVVSSVLVSLYNFPPCLTNSEIGLDLPCEEDLWAAETPSAWFALGGGTITDQGIPFAKALSSLLTTGQRHPLQPHQLQARSRPTDARLSTPDLPQAAFRSSSFGCLVLINALHNYIWETRQRHLGRQWTTQETEAMQAHIGPALLAYQAVWRESSHHSIQRPNAHLANDLAADCVPFLDLAFVRLFLSLGRSKECFWNRDWDGISQEITTGCEVISRNDSTSGPASDSTIEASKDSSNVNGEVKMEANGPYSGDQSSKRERHLRKAAAHAAHSLHTADAHNVSLADGPSREVHLGSAICTLDCAEILAEWVSVVQERVGRYLGMIGKDDVDFETVPAIMLLESEDTALLQKIDALVQSAEQKVDAFQTGSRRKDLNDTSSKNPKELGLAARLLKVAARECECAATWSVMNLMARNLEAQSEHMQARAEKSLLKTE